MAVEIIKEGELPKIRKKCECSYTLFSKRCPITDNENTLCDGEISALGLIRNKNN